MAATSSTSPEQQQETWEAGSDADSINDADSDFSDSDLECGEEHQVPAAASSSAAPAADNEHGEEHPAPAFAPPATHNHAQQEYLASSKIWQHELQRAVTNSVDDPSLQGLGGRKAASVNGSVAACGPLGSLHEETDGAGGLQRVPPAALALMQSSLAGPFSAHRYGTRLWTMCSYHGFIAGYNSVRFITLLRDPAYLPLQISCIPVWGGIGVIIGEVTMVMGRALAEVGDNREELITDEEAGQPGEATNFAYLLGLLRSQVSPGVAKDIKRRVVLAKALSLALAVVIIGCYLGQFWILTTTPTAGMLPFGDIGWPEQVLAVIGMICCFPTGMLLTGWLLFITVPCVVISDRIRRQARGVRRMRGCTASGAARVIDWDSLMRALQLAHSDTTRLSLLLGPGFQMFMSFGILAGTWWFGFACTSREGIDPRSPILAIMEYFPAPYFFFSALLVVIIALWPLHAPAGITDACDELVEAIEELRYDVAPAEKVASNVGAIGFDYSYKKPQRPAPDLVRINGLVQFAAELNQARGLCFTLRGSRIGPETVTSIMGFFVVLMVVLYVSVTSFLR